jgi:3-hydroxybutyrate dehydrogenase
MTRPVAVITGAASGIGRGLMAHLASHYRVVGVDIQAEQLYHAASEAGEGAEALVADLSQQAQIDTIAARLGEPVSVLINNAGMQHVAPLEDFPPAKWREMIDVMLVAGAMLCRAFLPGMRGQDYGRIITIGSIHALVASPFKSAYVAAKHGLVGLTRTLALETAASDITVNAICPGYVRTPLVDLQIAQQARAHGISEDKVISEIMLAPCPKGVFITQEELNGCVDFLLSDAARNITGQSIVVDGGWTAQ